MMYLIASVAILVTMSLALVRALLGPSVYDRVLVAVGRRANGDKLGLDKAGVSVNERGVIDVDEVEIVIRGRRGGKEVELALSGRVVEYRDLAGEPVDLERTTPPPARPELAEPRTVQLRLSRALPLWGDRVRQLGFELPKTSGFVAERLREIGAWLSVNGESIYGTQASPAGGVPSRLSREASTMAATDFGSILFIRGLNLLMDTPSRGFRRSDQPRAFSPRKLSEAAARAGRTGFSMITRLRKALSPCVHTACTSSSRPSSLAMTQGLWSSM